jgi:hypothetical protein
MRYLRMLTNAIAGGVIAATYLVVLVLQLNPHVPVVSMTALRWFVALLAFYGPYLSVALFLLLLVREAIATRPLSPAWFSVRLIAWLAAVGGGAAAIVTWLNLREFRAVLTTAAAERMEQGATATTIFAIVLMAIALLRYSFGRRGSRMTAGLLIAATVGSIAVPLWLRGPVELPVPAARRIPRTRDVTSMNIPRVRVIELDGASLGFIRQRVAAGQLPNFGHVLDRGAAIELETLRPTQAAPVLAALSTGKYPPKTSVRSNAFYRVSPDDPVAVDLLPDYCFAYALVYQGFIAEERRTSESLDARPIWDVLADYDLVAGVVGWPLTDPARAERGYIVSDRFHESVSSPLRFASVQAGYPTTAVDLAREAFDGWQARSWHDVLPAAAGPAEPTGATSARWDRAYAEAAWYLEQQFAPHLTAVRFGGLDHFGHLYLRDAQPELFGEFRRDGVSERSILDQHYAYIDGEVGRAIRRLAPGDLLLIVAGFGLEPTTLSKRLLARALGWPEETGTHERAPRGFVLAFGTNVAPGRHRPSSIVDVAPTVLYYMGLDVGRDMDGVARTDWFLSTFTREHPVTYIRTHEK